MSTLLTPIIDQLETDRDRFKQLVNGDETTTVQLEDRVEKSIAGQVKDHFDNLSAIVIESDNTDDLETAIMNAAMRAESAAQSAEGFANDAEQAKQDATTQSEQAALYSGQAKLSEENTSDLANQAFQSQEAAEEAASDASQSASASGDSEFNASEHEQEAKQAATEAQGFASDAQGFAADAADNSRLDIGNVSTLNPTDNAFVSISGVAGSQILDLGIPRGDQGVEGDRGPRGLPGSQVVLNIKGASDTTTGLPSTGEDGDGWLVSDQLYVYSNGTWDGPILDFAPQMNALLDMRTVYVSVAGNDLNSGLSLKDSVRSVKRGLEISRDNPEPVVVKVEPGDYVEEGNLEVPANSALISSGGQYVTNLIAAEGFEEENMVLVNSGSYVQGFCFDNQRVDSFEDPSGGFAVAFAPGARIMRSPYIRDSTQRSNVDNNVIVQPLDPQNANPLVGRGGGMLLADRAVLSRFSAFPYMLAFGATPRSCNGLGYVAKNGAGINGISSLTIFSRKSFYALNGGQITLNNSGTQFGDISMHAKGFTPVVSPYNAECDIIQSSTDSDAIAGAKSTIIDTMWNILKEEYPIETADSVFEDKTRRDAGYFIDAISADFRAGSEMSTQSFSLGLFDYKAEKVYDTAYDPLFVRSWVLIGEEIKALVTYNEMVDGLVDLVVRTINDPEIINFTSLIESLGHQFNNAGAGVNRLALPVNFRQPGQNKPVPFSVLEEDGGKVRWSGSDEKNIQYFGNDFRIDGRTGRVSGRAFDRTVRQIARRMANTRIL